ncbi:lycopene beta-cyclase CrtY [Sphingomonas immobilis]|uniref:Lycopene beta-cyclase CrtY n=1 Tax=Sphingomonas immobilis TaxID=3063997 RepID=A0ABT8ZXX1_9SPHN|nr:lycopene beta-cyclase CrtY [Sphingomonas sp. CA1-15]MDO7841626.1 lycopene beta-cyclase CrtY [Sphingomonas sp. CA1-15]
MPTPHTCDLAILGGGLAGGLIALALRAKRPDLDLAVIEAEGALGGNHVWSFFASDVADADRWLIEPLIAHRWDGYDVAFPAHRRAISEPYRSIDSERFDAVVRASLAPGTLLSARVVEATATGVTLADGTTIAARGVIDARGTGDLGLLDLGWQKFAGQELLLSAPHGAAHPLVMDATVPQDDGYRFVYCLPFGPERMFVEDTYYSETPVLDAALLGLRIANYAKGRGWDVTEVRREETGVLPVAMGGDFEGYWGRDGVAKAGMRAGLFHPMTGYSLPDAVRLASLIARTGDLSGAALHDLTHGYARRLWRARGFYRILAKMLFRAADPPERYRILERFYRLDARLIGRFYAGNTHLADKVRILSGKPPVPIGRAVAALRS